jgi:hypothetical protein
MDGRLTSVFQVYGRIPFLMDMEEIEKIGKELPSSYRLIGSVNRNSP